MPKEKFLGAFVKKTARSLALAGVLASGVDSVNAQPPTRQGEKQINNQEQQINKYTQWLKDLAEDSPVLVGAIIEESGREGGINLDPTKNILSYTIYLKNQKPFIIQTEKIFTLRTFTSAIEQGLSKLGVRNSPTEARPNPVERKPVVTEAIAQQWLNDLISSEPDLKGANLLKDNKYGGIGGDGVYHIVFGSDSMCIIEIPASQNNQIEFTKKLKEFLRGDTYKKEAPRGIEVEIGKGAAKIMGLSRVTFNKHGGMHFWRQKTGPNEFSILGTNNENKKMVWEKSGENNLALTITERDGSISEYQIINGNLNFENPKIIK